MTSPIPWKELATMPRPRTPLSANGSINVVEVEPGKWRARTRHRFEDGKVRQVERFASTKAKAQTALRSALTVLSAPGTGPITKDTRLDDLADRYLKAKRVEERKPLTLDHYATVIDLYIRPRFGALAVGEATTGRLQRGLDALRAEVGAPTARNTRRVLSGMLGMAARADAIRSNPVRDVAPIKGSGGKAASAIPMDDLPRLLEAVRGDEFLRTYDMVDLIEFLAATGCRIGEALALRWDDVDLKAGQVTIRGNVVRARGRGLLIQTSPKTEAGARTLTVPAKLIGVLLERRVSQGPNDLGIVFPTILGHLRDPNATARDWRSARSRLGFPDVKFHSFRKSVATIIDYSGGSARDAAEYLGHADPAMTQRVYMSREVGGRKAASAVEQYL